MNRQRLEAKIENPEFRRELFHAVFGKRAAECLKRYEEATRRGLARNWPLAGVRISGHSYRIYVFSTAGKIPAATMKKLEEKVGSWTIDEVRRQANQPPRQFTDGVFCGVMAARGALEPESPYTLYLEDEDGPSGLPLLTGLFGDEEQKKPAAAEPVIRKMFGDQSVEEVAARQAALAQQMPMNSEGDLMTQQQLSMAQQVMQQQLTELGLADRSEEDPKRR